MLNDPILALVQLNEPLIHEFFLPQKLIYSSSLHYQQSEFIIDPRFQVIVWLSHLH